MSGISNPPEGASNMGRGLMVICFHLKSLINPKINFEQFDFEINLNFHRRKSLTCNKLN